MATFERHEGRNLKGIDPDAKDRDLEQYGVWVKAEPRDVLEEPDTEDASPLSEPTGGADVLDESFLTDEEEVFLGAGGTAAGTGKETEDVFMSTSETPSLMEEELAVPDLEAAEAEDLPRIPDMAEFESLEDLGVPIEEFTPDEASIGAARGSAPEEPVDITEFSLDEAEPVLDAGTETDFESLDIDLKFDDTLPPRPDAAGGSVERSAQPADDGFETVTDFDDFLSGSEPGPSSEEFETPPPSAAPPSPSESFPETEEFSLEDIPELPPESPVDDLAELERDLSAASAPSAAPRPPADATSDILLRIAGELSSIKEELVSLKSQIAAMKSASAAEGTEESREPEGGKAGGFFDEEEDETIALTGDELDNILNTAEFSEESAEPAREVSEPMEGLEDLLPESGDYAAEASADAIPSDAGIEELRLSEGEAEEAMIPGDETISALAEEGVAPLTEPPEDTSYLEEPEELQLAGEEELPEAPLLEPSPEELDIEDLVEERFEEAEELPLAEFESAEDLEAASDLEEESEELEELTLELDSEEAPLVLETPENINVAVPEIEEELGVEDAVPEFVEALPEVEEVEEAASFGEIPLHHEETSGTGQEPRASAREPEPPEAGEAEVEAPSEVETLLVEDLEAGEVRKPEPIPNRIKDEVRSVLVYLDKLLESLPEEKIEEFAKSDHFETYKRLFEELGLV